MWATYIYVPTIAKAKTRDEIILIERRECPSNDGDGLLVWIKAITYVMKAPSVEGISPRPFIAFGEVDAYYQIRGFEAEFNQRFCNLNMVKSSHTVKTAA